MTTFTLQDLTPEQQVAVNKHEEMHKMFQEMGGDLTGGKTNVFDAPTTQPTVTKEEWMEYGMSHPISQSAIDYATQHAPEPQATLADVINTICTQLQLLATVISSSQAQTKAGENSLQECVSLTLQQAEWFRTMVRHELIGVGIEEIAKDAVEDIVENEVESYFDNRFSPEDHFDFGDAVENAVDDRLDDIVRDRVMDSLEEVVAEKLSEASIKVEFN
jgi:hypothetical protein